MAVEERIDLLRRSKFDRAHYALSWAWVGLHATLALWTFTPIGGRAAAAAGFGGLGLLFLCIYFGRFLLLDFHSVLDMRQRFALFMVSLSFIALPVFLVQPAPLALSLAALNIPLIAIACRPFDFHRLYFLNLIWLALFAQEFPGAPPALWALEGVLIPAVFAADYLAWKAEGKPEARRASLRMLAYATLMYAGAALAALGAVWAAFPALRPTSAEWRPELETARWRSAPPAANLDPRALMELARDSGFILIALIILLLLLKYIDRRLGRRRGMETLTGEGRMVYRGKTRHDVAAPEPVFDLSTPRGRIEYAYNLFLNRMREKQMGRKPSQTPAEYAETLRAISTVPPRILAEATRDFEAAKYGEKEFTEEQAEAYRRRTAIMADEAEAVAEDDGGQRVR